MIEKKSGERGDSLTEKEENSGEIEIADAIWKELTNFINS